MAHVHLVVFAHIHGVGNRSHEEGAAEEILVVQRAGLGVGGEIHEQRTHEGVAVAVYAPGCGIEVGEQTVAQADELLDGIKRPCAALPEPIDFTGRAGAV